MNRVLWAAAGAVLLAAGVLGLLVGGRGAFRIDRRQTIITAEMVNAWNGHKTFATIVTIVAGLLLALLGVLLLRAQLREPSPALVGDLYLELPPQPWPAQPPPPERVGSTGVASRALYRGLRTDLERDRQIKRAAVQLTGALAHPQLRLRLAVTPDADLARLAGLLDQAVERFTTTSGVRPELYDVVVRMPQRAIARVE